MLASKTDTINIIAQVLAVLTPKSDILANIRSLPTGDGTQILQAVSASAKKSDSPTRLLAVMPTVPWTPPQHAG